MTFLQFIEQSNQSYLTYADLRAANCPFTEDQISEMAPPYITDGRPPMHRVSQLQEKLNTDDVRVRVRAPFNEQRKREEAANAERLRRRQPIVMDGSHITRHW